MKRLEVYIVRVCLSIVFIILVGLLIRQIADFRTAIIAVVSLIFLWTFMVARWGKRGQKAIQLLPFSEAVIPDEIVAGVRNADRYIGILVTASATTGWFDWVHGEVWIFPQGILRIPSGLGRTLTNGFGPTVDRQHLKIQQFDYEQFQQLITKKPNRWTPREQIVQAYLRQGLSTDRLRLILVNGRSIQLLWLPIDNAFPVMQKVFAYWLGNQLVID